MMVNILNPLLPLADFEPGDLVFFYRFPHVTSAQQTEFELAIISSSVLESNVYHVGVVVNCSRYAEEPELVHASTDGVQVQGLRDVVDEMEPDYIELCCMNVNADWKSTAAKWARQQVGAEYNDLFTPRCVNSRSRRAFYCCQLAVEAYRAASESGEESPFLAHTLNFADAKGQLLPNWVDYYRRLSPGDPHPPNGQPGSHPSKLRASPIVRLSAAKLFITHPNRQLSTKPEGSLKVFQQNKRTVNPAEGMRKFLIPKDLLDALHFINGARVNLKSQSKFTVVEPRNGEKLTECCAASAAQLNDVIAHSQRAQHDWAQRSWSERRQILQRVADLIRRHYKEVAEWEVRDNGKPISEARVDVLSCADTFEYFSGVDLAGEHLPYDDRARRYAYTRREPLGVVGAIGAWNYPIQTATWKIAPAIACGNSIVYKPSPLAPVSSILLAQILQCAGVPDGVVNIVQGEAETGTALCLSPAVKKISFTGSAITGRAIAAACARHNLKPVTLELGGKSSCIIFADADMECAVHGALMANFYSQGQVCSNASKVLVHRSILDEFVKKLLLKTEELKIGDPMNESTHVGACITLDHLEKVRNHIKGAVAEGAQLLYGGECVDVEAMERGFYLSPCILSNITQTMRIYHEEVFGAVLLIIPFDDDEEALRIANDTEAGLAAGIFTNDLNKAHTFAQRLEAGNVYVNTYNDVSPYVPFGGYKQSGYGRENGKAAIEHYSQIKSVFVNASGRLDNPFP